MERVRKLNNHVRRANFAANKVSQDLMLAVTDHDPEYESVTISSLIAAAEQMEKSARDLRDGIAIFKDTKPAS